MVPSSEDKSIHMLQVLLYSVLTSYVVGEALTLVQQTSKKNGFEAWRRIVGEYEPRVAQRRLGLLSSLLYEPDFGKSVEEFLHKWRLWELSVANYEAMVGKVLDPELKVAAIVNFAPSEVQLHLRLNAAEYEENYDRLKSTLEGYLQSRRTWTTREPDVQPMEIGWTGYQDWRQEWRGDDRAKGRGKGKGDFSWKGFGKSGGKAKGKDYHIVEHRQQGLRATDDIFGSTTRHVSQARELMHECPLSSL